MEEQEKKTVVDILQRDATKLHKDLSAIESMIAYLNSQSANLEALAEPYNPNVTYPEKILYVLKQKGESLTKDIVEYIIDKEPDISKKGLSLNIGKAASRLVKDKKIKLTKVGNQNKYGLGS